jgi:hypothetical protein
MAYNVGLGEVYNRYDSPGVLGGNAETPAVQQEED